MVTESFSLNTDVSVCLSNTFHEFLVGNMTGRREKCLPPIVSIRSFDSRWGYGWESNPGSITIFACPSQCYEAFGVPSRHSIRWIALGIGEHSRRPDASEDQERVPPRIKS